MADYKVRCQGKQILINPGTNAGTMVIGGGMSDPSLYWHGSANACIGHSTEDWYGLYAKIETIIDQVSQQYFNNYTNEEFFATDYRSFTQNASGNLNSYIGGQRYFHAGAYRSAIITCY